MAYMSQEGYDKLIAELKRLEGIERPKASAAIAEARDKGDLSENSEYEAAKEAQAHLESKINLLKQQITEAKIVDTVGSIAFCAHSSCYFYRTTIIEYAGGVNFQILNFDGSIFMSVYLCIIVKHKLTCRLKGGILTNINSSNIEIVGTGFA